MRVFNLVRTALEAEALRLRLLARRMAGRVILGCLAFLLLSGAVVCAHVAAWFWLRAWLSPAQAALALGGGDLLLAVIFAFLAARSSPGRVEREALALRQQALDEAAWPWTMAPLLLRALEWGRRARKKPR